MIRIDLGTVCVVLDIVVFRSISTYPVMSTREIVIQSVCNVYHEDSNPLHLFTQLNIGK